jgi:hypothetical protein
MIEIGIAGHIVFQAVRRLNIPPPDIDSSLRDLGLFDCGARIAFREFVRTGTLNEGFVIDREHIPLDADTTLREVIDAVSTYALPGQPTTRDDDV